MKVLHLTTHLNVGGITSYILRLVNPFQDMGVKTHVLSSGGERTPAFLQAGAVTHELPIRTKSELHPKLYLALPAVLKIIRENQIDLLHAHTRVTQVLSFWIQRITGIRMVTTCHGFYKRRLGRRLLPGWGDRVIAISQPVERFLIENFKVPPSRVTTVYNAVDLEGFQLAYRKHRAVEAKERYGFNGLDPVIGVVSRLVKDKGQEYLVRAIHSLKTRFSNIRLLIVGEGREKETLRRLVQDLGIQNRVVFTNNLMDVTAALAAMDIFAFPAVWREGFGLSIIEAMACAKPVIVTNIWALNSLIEHRVNGILVEPKQVDSLADAIAMLLTNPNLREKIGLEGKRMAEDRFSIPRMAKELACVYEEILQQNPEKSLTGVRRDL